MNWYKKAQKIPTMENITWAIDKLIAENYEFTVEELMQASQGYDEQQYALPKAAQVATKKKRKKYRKYEPPPRRSPIKVPENASPLDYEVLEWFERGTTTRDIAKELDLETSEVAKILKKYYPSKGHQDEYLKNKYEENILNTTDEMSQKMMSNFNALAFGPKDIASILNVDPKFITRTLKKHNINLNHLVTERKNIIVANIEQIAKELPSGFKAKDIQKEFKRRYNFILKDTSAYSAMKLNNIGEKNKNDPDTIFQAFTTYVDRMITGGRRTLVEKMPERIPEYIDRFFQDYGEKHGFIPPYEQETLKKMFLTKIQMRWNTVNMERNKYTPVDYSENNPATFLYDRE